MTITLSPAENSFAFLPDSVYGFNLSWLSNTTLTVGVGFCRDSTLVFDIIDTTADTINGAINGLNGLDTGTLAASTAYAVYKVYDPSGRLPTGSILSLSFSTPLLPTGYAAYRRIGGVMTDGSVHFLKFWQSGVGKVKQYLMDEPLALLSGGTATSFTAVDCTGLMFPINNLPIILQAIWNGHVAGDAANVIPGTSSATTGRQVLTQVADVSVVEEITTFAQLVTGAPNIKYKAAAAAVGGLSLYLSGFADLL